MIRRRNLDAELKWTLENSGLLPGVAARKSFVYASTSAAPYAYWNGRATGIDAMYSSISAAHTATTTARNDVVLLAPESHTQSSALTWSNSLTHLVGMAPTGMWGFRSRIGHSGVVTPMLTVSGSDNLFANLYFMHGNGDASNLNCLTVSGSRNTFMNCQFAGPINATEGGTAGYKTIILTGSLNYFNHCIVGAQTAGMSAANCLLNFNSSQSGNIFEDCIFMIQGNATTPLFITVTDTFGGNTFIRCKFFNIRGQATSLAYAMTWTPAGGGLNMLFDECVFAGVDDIIATGNVSRAVFTAYGETTTKIGIAQQTTAG